MFRALMAPLSRLSGAQRAAAWCGLVVAVEAIVILFAIGNRRGDFLVGDGPDYNTYALNLVRHGVFSNSLAAPFHPGVTRAPGYPAFLALLHLISIRSVVLVRLAQFALVAITAWLVYRIGSVIADARAALIGALMTATYLPLLWFATRALTEVAACLLATLLVYLLLLAIRRPSGWRWGAVGLTLAAGAYVRPEFAGLGVIIALVVLLSGRGTYLSRARWYPPTTIVATMVVALSPWMVRNAVVSHSFVPVDAQFGGAVLASADEYAGKVSPKFTVADFQRYVSQENAITARVEPPNPTAAQQVAADHALTRRALNIIGALSVGTILRNIPSRLAYLWSPADPYPVGRSWSSLAHHLAQLQYALLALLSVAGIALRRRTLSREWPIWLPAVYLTILHLITDGEPRYSLPARPALLVYAGIAAYALWRRLRVEPGF